MKNKYLIVIFVILMSAILLTGCTSTKSAQVATPTPQIVYVTVYATPNTPTAVPTPTASKILNFSGNGDDVQSFTVTGRGIGIFTMKYSGAHNFIIRMNDENGELVDLLANEIGSYSGRTSSPLSTGKYYLDVKASGPWTIDIDLQ
jgi:hypothetical protein